MDRNSIRLTGYGKEKPRYFVDARTFTGQGLTSDMYWINYGHKFDTF